MRIGWLVNAEHFVTKMPFSNCGIYQPPNVHFGDYAKQRNGSGGREKDLYAWVVQFPLYVCIFHHNHNSCILNSIFPELSCLFIENSFPIPRSGLQIDSQSISSSNVFFLFAG
jgi:hypothetical protein